MNHSPKYNENFGSKYDLGVENFFLNNTSEC